ncbi:hypothetical protein VP01_2961g2 [Puccinia sorghi]|uniref:Uncharacterized protein n=1 Tax=Puccinia sorghi TaxID=27349 RepID=A0A0L6V1M2_9BASI|nr:hypothetical protein VP01_2961g2 [Puccinia sorghi]
MCPSFILRSLKSFEIIYTIYSTWMVMEIVDSGVFWRQWNKVKKVGFGLLGGETLVRNSISQLKVSRINNKIPPFKWLSKMGHGKAIANTFQRPVFFLSLEESLSLSACYYAESSSHSTNRN